MKKHLPLFMATLLDSPHGTSLPEIDLSPYPSGTHLVKINFERGVSVVRKSPKDLRKSAQESRKDHQAQVEKRITI